LFGPVSIVIPPLFFYLSRIGNSFPKRVLIRKKPASHPALTLETNTDSSQNTQGK
jgi:hypothetical protein